MNRNADLIDFPKLFFQIASEIDAQRFCFCNGPNPVGQGFRAMVEYELDLVIQIEFMSSNDALGFNGENFLKRADLENDFARKFEPVSSERSGNLKIIKVPRSSAIFSAIAILFFSDHWFHWMLRRLYHRKVLDHFDKSRKIEMKSLCWSTRI